MTKVVSEKVFETLQAISKSKPIRQINKTRKYPAKLVGEAARLKDVHLSTSHALTEQIAYSKLFGSFFQRKAKEKQAWNNRRIKDLQRFSYNLEFNRTDFDIPYGENSYFGHMLRNLSERMRKSDIVLIFEPVVPSYSGLIKLKMKEFGVTGDINEVCGEDLMACLWYNSVSNNVKKSESNRLNKEEGLYRDEYDLETEHATNGTIDNATSRGESWGHMGYLKQGYMDSLEQGHTDFLEQGHMDSLKQGHMDSLEQGHTNSLEQGHTNSLEQEHMDSLEQGHTNSLKQGHTNSLKQGHMDFLEQEHMNSLEQGHMDSLEQGRMDSLEQGHTNSLEQGHKDSLEQGHTNSLKQGHMDSLEQGHMDSLEQGHMDSLEQGHTDYLKQEHMDSLEQGHTNSLKQGHMDSLDQGHTDFLEQGHTNSLEQEHMNSLEQGHTNSLKQGHMDSLEQVASLEHIDPTENLKEQLSMNHTEPIEHTLSAQNDNNILSIFDYWTKSKQQDFPLKNVLNFDPETEYIVCLLNGSLNKDISTLSLSEDEVNLLVALLSEDFLGGAQGVRNVMSSMIEPWKLQDDQLISIKPFSDLMKTIASMELVAAHKLGSSLCLTKEPTVDGSGPARQNTVD